MKRADVVVVGAGLAGLACASSLEKGGLAVRIVEASDGIGGRVRTDTVDGFRLDRGFQVLLTAYPTARRLLDYESLGLKCFRAGALVRSGGRFVRMGDPFRHGGDIFPTLFAKVGSLSDKLKMMWARGAVCQGRMEGLMAKPEVPTVTALRERYGLSDPMIYRYFRPYFGGIFLEANLETSSRAFEMVFRMLAKGGAALPAEGIGALPAQLAARLSSDVVQLGAPVARIEGTRVVLASGEAIEAKAVVVATAAPEAGTLLRKPSCLSSRGVVCLHFAAESAPVEEPLIVLNGDSSGPINDLAVPSSVQPGYAPAGAALVSATVLGHPRSDDAALEASAREQLQSWFGPVVRSWRTLRILRIPHALPDQAPGCFMKERSPVLGPGLFGCGDGFAPASIDGALTSGERAGAAVLHHLLGTPYAPPPKEALATG